MLLESKKDGLKRIWQLKPAEIKVIIDRKITGFVFKNRFGYVHKNPHTINRAIKRIYTACN